MTKLKLKVTAKGPLLTLEFQTVEDMSLRLENISNFSEGGSIRRRQGHNFPAAAATSYFKKRGTDAGKLTPEEASIKQLLNIYTDVKYVVAWRKGDVAARVHELAHSCWALDAVHRSAVEGAWRSLPLDLQSSIREFLLRLGYEDNDNVIIDEFGAYWLTERNAGAFFGVKGMPEPPQVLRQAVLKV